MQKIFIHILLLTTTLSVSAQFSIATSRIFGGNSLDEARDIVTNADTSRIFWGGRTFSTDGDIPSNAGGADYWITKWDIDGTQIWNKTYGGFNNDDLTTLMPHTDGGVIAFGTTRNDQGLFGNLPGISGGWLMRTNTFGDLILGQIFGGSLSETAVDAYRHVSGNVTMALESSSPTVDGKSNHGIFDVWIVQVDPTFNIKWSALMGGSLQDSPNAMTSDINGNIYVAATSNSNLSGLPNNSGGSDVWVFKLGPQGNLLWQKKFGGSANDVANDILFHKDGLVYVTAHSSSEDGEFIVNHGSNDIWLIKLDSEDGSTKGLVRYGGSGNDFNARLEKLGSSQLVISATSSSSDFDLTGNKGFNDVWVFTTDLNGNIIQQMNYGGSANDLSADVMVIDTVIHVFSTTQSSDKNVPMNTLAQQDIWYMTLNTNAGPCSDQFQCLQDSTLNNEIFPPSDETLLCVAGCNAGLSPGPFFLQGPCADFEHATAFFKVTTDANADLLTLSVSSDEFNHPQIGLLRSGNCSNYTQVKCASGENGFVLLQYVKVSPLTTYIVAISDADGNEGTFNFCTTSLNIEFCNERDSLYVTSTSLGSPPHGPYKPGEKVQFCYELLDWNKLDCNGFQGLVPSFGPGWDPSSFDLFGMPIRMDSLLAPVSTGFWDWYKVGDVRYNISNPINGFDGGQGMPAGWYFLNTGDVPPNNGPDETTGDIYTCLATPDRWKVCFTLQVLEECEMSLDASVSMRTFSDGELGSHESLACAYDQPETFNATMVCCLHPGIEVINDLTICSEDTVILIPETNILPPVTYSWIAYPESSVTGAFSQNHASQFYQILKNETSSLGNVRYVFWAEGVGCQTEPVEFNIRVRPSPTSRLTLTGPNIVCSGSTVTLNFESVGTPPFAIELLQDNVFFANVLSESALLSIDVDPVFTSRFRIGSIRDAFCEGDGFGLVNVTVKPVSASVIDTLVCEDESVIVGNQLFTDPGVYTITVDNAAANGCDSIISLTLSKIPSLTETITEEICHGDTVFVLETPYTETTDELIEYTNPQGCPAFIHLQLTVIDTLFSEINQTICAGDTLNFEGTPVFQSGNYIHVSEPNPGCFEKTTLHLAVLPGIFINDLTIVGDDGSGNGAILVEVVGGSPPFTYLWSNGETTGSLFEIDHGEYSMTATDSHGCSQTFTFIVPLVSATKDPDANLGIKIWPTLASSGEPITVFSTAETPSFIKNIRCWNVNGQQINLLEASEHSFIFKAPDFSGLCFVQVTLENGNTGWFKIIID
jgi:hypothetical protein